MKQKRILALVIMLAMILTVFVGCGDSKKDEEMDALQKQLDQLTEQLSDSSKEEKKKSSEKESESESEEESSEEPSEEESDVEFEKEEKKESKSKSKKRGTPTKLSDDLRDTIFSLDDELYQLPQDFQALADNGWEIEKDNRDKTIQYGQTARTDLVKGDFTIQVQITNYGMDLQPLDKCHVKSIKVTREYYGAKKTPELYISDDISLDSHIDDVIELYGKPEPSDDSGRSLQFYRYEIQPDSEKSYGRIEAMMSVDVDYPKQLYILEINNDFDEPEDFAADVEYDGSVPSYVKNYKKPSKLGSDWDDFTLEIEKEYYQLPIPLATLLDDGWEIRDTGTVFSQNYDASVLEQIIPAKTGISTLGGLNLMNKKDRAISVSLYNYADVGQPLRNCMVIGVNMYIYASDDNIASIAFPGKITLDSSIKEIESAYGKPDEYDDDSDYSIRVVYGDKYNDEFRFDWDIADKIISYFSYQYQPKELD